jgi:hypothetical protein
MKKKPNYNDLARELPLPFRNGTKIINDALGILEITIEGETEVTSHYTHSPKSLKDIQNEDDISSLLLTSVTFREYQAPPLENDGESDKQVLSCRGKF